MKFEIGPGMKCDLETLIERRLLIQASPGGGKSRTLRRILEQTHGKVQQIVIDPEGELVSLRENFDYLIVAGTGGDAQAHPRTAALLAERLVALNVSAILDLYELKQPQQVEFVKRFCTALMEIPKKHWRPRILAIDESQLFAPEGAQSESTAAVIDVATRGRKRGHALLVATQRLSLLNKNVAAALNNKLIGFTSLDTDLKRAAFELGFDKQQMLALRDLPPMRFWGFGPALTRVPTLVDIGPHVTSHPKLGQKLAAPPPPPTEKIKALLPQLADLPAEAEHKAKTESELRQDLAAARATITRLERSTALKVEPKAETKVERVVVPMLTEEQLDGLKSVAGVLQTTVAGARGLVETLTAERGALTDALASIDRAIAQATRPQPAARPMPARAVRQAVRPARVLPAAQPMEGIGNVDQKILDKLAELEALGLAPADKQQLGLFAGYTNIRSGGFSEPMGRLIAAGLIAYPQTGMVELTETGRAQAAPVDAPMTTADLQERILGKLDGPRRKLLAELLAIYPESIAKDELGARCGYTNVRSGGFSEPLGSLRTLRLVDYPGKGLVRAAPALFLAGAA